MGMVGLETMLRAAEIPFRFEMPFEVWHKAGEPGKERRIGGLISTESKDRQGEVVLQRGLDFSEFLKHGWINDNHSKETTGIVGYPTLVEKTTHRGRPATRFEGYLLQGYPRADQIWELANVLQKTGRRLGFSIEGAVQRRDGLEGEVVAKAKVRNVAVTNCPVNTDTQLEVIAKSLMAMEAAEPSEEDIRRALSAGAAISAPGSWAPGNGFALRTESMERVRDVRRALRRKRRVSKSEAIEIVKSRYQGLTDAQAQRIVEYAARSR